MTEAHNIDDILVKSMQGGNDSNTQQASQPIISQNTEQEQNQQQEQLSSTKEPDADTNPDQVDNQETDKKPEQLQKEGEQQKPKETKETNSKESSPIDEYGNPVEKPRLYTEEELNQRIRDRLSRGKYAEQEQQQYRPQQPNNYTQQQVNQAKADGFEHDPNSEETWDQQLKGFMNQVLDEREANRAEQQWRQQETAKQAEFQDKFSSGMSKYNDFHQVVAGKPITDSMMLATRNLDNPAAFVYGASKMHPQELDRISRINDPYVQAAEIGILHERMVKERKGITNAPKPIQAPRGDVPSRVQGNKQSIDQRILADAKQRRR